MLLAMLDNRPSPPEIPSLDLSQITAARNQPDTRPAPLPKRSWHPRAHHQPRRTSDRSDKSHNSKTSSKCDRSKADKGESARKSSKLRKLPPVDLTLPLSRLSEALDLAPLSLPTPSSKERRATKAALALRTLILDPPALEVVALSLPAIPPMPQKGTKGRKSTAQIPQLREKDVERLRTQLLKPDEAKMVIASARNLHINKPNASVERAVCLDCSEYQADYMIVEAKRIEASRREKEKHLDAHRFSTLKAAPPPPPRLPVLLSLFAGLSNLGASVTATDGTIMTLGLFEPASAMSLHRPLAGALPSAETLRRGFDALINAESKIYLYEGPSHKNIHPPSDRISVYTYWWGFEIALPPPTLEYLGRAKSIATSILNLLSVIVYAVPGGTRELAPFVGVLSRYIENEWKLLKSQDKGKGVVCGATWFIPAALTARPWDFGGETLRDHAVNHEIAINPPEPPSKAPRVPAKTVSRPNQPKDKAEGVVVGIGRGVEGGKSTPSHDTSPGAPTTAPPLPPRDWKRKAPVPAMIPAAPPLPRRPVVCDEHRSIHIAHPPPPSQPTRQSPLAHALPSVTEGQSQPGSVDPSPVSSPDLGSDSPVSTPDLDSSSSPSHSPNPDGIPAVFPVPPRLVRPKNPRSSSFPPSVFRRKQPKGRPPPIDLYKPNIPTDSSPSSPTDSSLPTPSTISVPTPSGHTSFFASGDGFVGGTLRLVRVTFRRKEGRQAREMPWTKPHQHAEAESPDLGRSVGVRRGRSIFELRRFYNRSM